MVILCFIKVKFIKKKHRNGEVCGWSTHLTEENNQTNKQNQNEITKPIFSTDWQQKRLVDVGFTLIKIQLNCYLPWIFL